MFAMKLACSFKNQIFTAKPLKVSGKDLSKAIVHRLKLRSQFLKLQTHESRLSYNKQRTLCVTLLRKAKKKYYKIFDNENKGNKTIALVEGNEVVTSNEKLAHTCSIFCEYCVPRFSFTSFHENNEVNNDDIDNT